MKFEYFIGFVVGMLFFLIAVLIMINVQTQTSMWSLIFAFTLSCFIASIVIVFSFSISKKDRGRIDEYEKKAKEEYDWLSNIKMIVVQTMKNYTADRDLSYNDLVTNLYKNIDVIFALRNYIRLREYESAIGKLRNKDKEKALKQIKEAEEVIAAIQQNPSQQRSIFLSKYEEAKRAFENMSRSAS